MAYSLQGSYSLTDYSISLTFNVGLTINIMKIFQQQDHFHGTNKHFLSGGGGGGILSLWGKVSVSFPLSPALRIAFSGWQFQQKHAAFENR